MRSYFFITLMFGLVLSFQNCSQKQADFQPGADTGGEAALVQKQYDLSLATSLELPNPSTSGLLEKSSSASLTKQNADISYHIDLANGQIEELDEASGSEEVKYCLSRDEVQEVKDILYSSAVCMAAAKAEATRVCATFYKAPYAVINFQTREGVQLGEQRSSCDYGPDLCGQQSSMLKGFLVHILQNLSSHSCTQ
jgi:hypothetical protein